MPDSAPACPRVINLWGGPGSGKSTTASGLFFLMKLAGFRTELVVEAAKEYTYDKAWSKLEDQFYVTAQQQRRLRRLIGEVDYIVTDSPLPMGLLYAKPPFTEAWFERSVWETFNTFNNVNIRLLRVKEYQTYGRSQNEYEARAIDEQVDQMSLVNAPKFDAWVQGTPSAPWEIFEFLFPDVDTPIKIA
jgi:hypothetical protein